MLWKTGENTSESRKSTPPNEGLSALIRAHAWRKSPKQMRHRPATGAASFVGLWSCLAAARSGKTTVRVADSAHKEYHATSTGCRSGIRRITSLQPLRLANGASPLQERTGQEAAMPG